MSELEELYQEMIMDHNRKPRNFRELEDANRSSNGFNPFCGDTVNLYLKVDGDVITDVAFQGSGCAISRASASMMTESIQGKTAAEAEKVFDAFHKMITRGPDGDFDAEGLEDLEVLSGVSEYPVRVKCATLSWHTLRAALEGQDETVKTE
jgi:nitrogen fixation NifU-like protein